MKPSTCDDDRSTPFRRCRPYGVTLVEILAVVAVVAILTALALPAGSMVREGARRTQCVARQRQIGLALHQYEAVHRMFPFGGGMIASADASVWTTFSVQAHLLPYVGRQDVYDAVNFHDRFTADPLNGSTSLPNGTVSAVTVATFLCPSDPAAPFDHAGNNMRYCDTAGPDRRGQGALFSLFTTPAMRLMQRGAAHTVAFSERARGDGTRQRFTADKDVMLRFRFPSDLAGARLACTTVTSDPPSHASHVGYEQLFAGGSSTAYNHILTPNSSTPDCAEDLNLGGAFTARSYHPGGVNVLFADGHVEGFSDAVDPDLWFQAALVALP